MSILELHSDVKACGMLILDLCNSLSQKLVSVAPGVRNEELDHNLLIRSVTTWNLKGEENLLRVFPWSNFAVKEKSKQ